MAGTARQGVDAWRRDDDRPWFDYGDDEDDDPWADDMFDALWDDDDSEPPPPGGWPCHG